MRRSTVKTITRHNVRKVSDLEEQWQTNKLQGGPRNASNSCSSGFSYMRARIYAIREGTQPRLAAIAIDFGQVNIHTGRYVNCTQEFETHRDQTARF